MSRYTFIYIHMRAALVCWCLWLLVLRGRRHIEQASTCWGHGEHMHAAGGWGHMSFESALEMPRGATILGGPGQFNLKYTCMVVPDSVGCDVNLLLDHYSSMNEDRMMWEWSLRRWAHLTSVCRPVVVKRKIEFVVFASYIFEHTLNLAGAVLCGGGVTRRGSTCERSCEVCLVVQHASWNVGPSSHLSILNVVWLLLVYFVSWDRGDIILWIWNTKISGKGVINIKMCKHERHWDKLPQPRGPILTSSWKSSFLTRITGEELISGCPGATWGRVP